MGWGGYELYGDSKREDGDGNGLLPRYMPTPQSPPVRDKGQGQGSSSGSAGVGSSAGVDTTTMTTAVDVASSNFGATSVGNNGERGVLLGQGGIDNGSGIGIGESVLRAVSEESEREYLERALLAMVQTSSSSTGAESGLTGAAGDGESVGAVFGGGETEEEMLERAKRESLAAFGHPGGHTYTMLTLHSPSLYQHKYTCT